MTRTRESTRRRRLLEASATVARDYSLRDHVRELELRLLLKEIHRDLRQVEHATRILRGQLHGAMAKLDDR